MSYLAFDVLQQSEQSPNRSAQLFWIVHFLWAFGITLSHDCFLLHQIDFCSLHPVTNLSIKPTNWLWVLAFVQFPLFDTLVSTG